MTLPGYNENRYNASLALSGLRSSDSGLYRCEVVVGINDEQDTVPLEVTGKCFFFPVVRTERRASDCQVAAVIKVSIFYKKKAQLALCLQSPT